MKHKFLLFLPLFILSSCGLEINNSVSFKIDGSGIWNDNYYTKFDASIKEKETTKIYLDKDSNKIFTSYTDSNFLDLETDHTLTYEDFEENSFGNKRKLSLINPLVKNGFVSKLFDGQLFCNGYYERARIQINEEGFSSSFYKPLQSASYLFLNFKSALDFKQHHPTAHKSDITLNISFYGEKNVSYIYSLKDVTSNSGNDYIFFGFSLENLDIKGMDSFSISYQLDKDEYIESEGIEIPHALFLYEFGFGNPTF